MNALDHVRPICAEVARRAAHVHIETSRLAAYVRSLAARRPPPPALDPRHHYADRGEATLAYVVTLDAVNFGSGYFPHLRKLPGLSGYFTIATRLKERFEHHGPLTASDLRRITHEECAEIFHQDLDGGPRAELMGLFARALSDLGRHLLDRHGGEFSRLVEAAGGSAARLVDLLAEIPYFRDVQQYHGTAVHFYKRAQLTAADLALAGRGEGWGRFTDLDRLTIFADNLVPHVLRHDGVLVYEPALAQRIDSEVLVPQGSDEEIEIRACAVHAVEGLVLEARRAGYPATAMEIDYVLWNRGQEASYKARPRHRTRTVAY
jgi:hypothetical protein